ncbi:hypothetical protein PEL8287_03149 [Roseovarius litorisediminis]|uniref:Uncharacterized protein n=1 Tax=Roseovarius litorisediminis TaxID=1312363 RepID=A0A1Y5T931_9RHOB|nr:ABZJ_00895 family protein [Roseovarius litorisediminis]SLN58658.1 hypothetical protein PEL8287_03149 [Roseovarius litorisediminis]
MNYPRYTIVFLVVAIGAALLITFVNTTLQSALGSSAQVLVPAMIGALIEGQRFARTSGRKATTAEAWRFTWIATIIALALNILLAFVGPAVVPEFAKLAIAPVMSMQFNVVLAIYAVGYLISNRFFLGIGISTELSAAARRNDTKGGT